MINLSRVLTLLCLLNCAILHEASTDRKLYIVYTGEIAALTDQELITANYELLALVTRSMVEAKDAIVHHYYKSLGGFSAMLTIQQAQQLAEIHGVVSVFESKMNSIQTTRSWDFLEIGSISQYNSLPSEAKSDVIIGIIDMGIWPESKSFCDESLGPVPYRFRGECELGDNFTSANCNRKIIGARFYPDGYEAQRGRLESDGRFFYRSPRDSEGHGTHVASIAAGCMVRNVSLFGMAEGTATGGVPSARIAIYKVCWFGFCTDADILVAIDDAISDNVDIISISLGIFDLSEDYFQNVISIGAFHAFQRGVLVAAAGGNMYNRSLVENAAPWILTVAASSIDRKFQTRIKLGNSMILKGSNLNHIQMTEFWDLITGVEARYPQVPPEEAKFCDPKDVDPKKYVRKILVCQARPFSYGDATKKYTFLPALERVEKEFSAVKQQTGYDFGIIFMDPNPGNILFTINPFPLAVINESEGKKLRKYICKKWKRKPTAKIYKTDTILYTKPAPEVAFFSSRGPNRFNQDIVKPDIAAPGVNILAAWSPVATSDTGRRSVNYNIRSGTSMACPHITAVAAILKSIHRDWSPAALKSAIMTTASILDNTNNPITRSPKKVPATPFDYGSGHVHASAAVNPGLVYDYNYHDILNFLCGTGADREKLRILTKGRSTTCTPQPSYNLNYPSIGVYNMNTSLTINRTVTYYGNRSRTYTPHIESPDGVNVTVFPRQLAFEKSGERRSFTLHFQSTKKSNGSFAFGALTWCSDAQNVRSPIAVMML